MPLGGPAFAPDEAFPRRRGPPIVAASATEIPGMATNLPSTDLRWNSRNLGMKRRLPLWKRCDLFFIGCYEFGGRDTNAFPQLA